MADERQFFEGELSPHDEDDDAKVTFDEDGSAWCTGCGKRIN